MAVEIVPNYTLAIYRHQLTLDDEKCPDKKNIRQLLLEAITKNSMTSFYKSLCDNPSLGIEFDSHIYEQLQANNNVELERLTETLKYAQENYGDTEVRQAIVHQAIFWSTVGNKEAAINQWKLALDKSVGVGSRIDVLLTLSRIGLFHDDFELFSNFVLKTKIELEKGGDWERKNRLKVYEALQLMTVCRDFESAANLLAESVSTFTAHELLSFESLIFYTVIMAMLKFDRPTLKSKIVNCPEIIQALEADEHLKGFLVSFYNCCYFDFMCHFVKIGKRVQCDRYLARHYRYFIRAIRLRAYAQFLEPVKSVTLESMANAFGVSVQFIETELCTFIASGKLKSRIDKVNGTVEKMTCNRVNVIYGEILQHGDSILNRIQKLSRMVDV